MTRGGTSLLAAVLVLMGIGPLAAQQPDTLAVGQRVRVTSIKAPAMPVTGELLAREDSALVVRVGSTDTRRIERGDIRRIEVSRGIRSGRRGGQVVGGVVGSAVGITAGIMSWPHSAGCHARSNTVLPWPDLDLRCLGSIGKGVGWVAVLGVAGGLAGAGLGTLVGGGFQTEAWEPIPSERIHVSIGIQPAGRLGLGAALAF